MVQAAPPAVHRSAGGAAQDHVKPCAPWEYSRSLRPGSHGNASNGGKSGKNSKRHRRSPKNRHPCRLRSDSSSWCHTRSKQLVEPSGVIDRQTEEIPYKEVR